MLLCTIGSAVNMLLSLRNPSVVITTFVVQLIAYPIGLGWDLIFPDRVFNVFGFKVNFKPGPFNFKEHVIIVVMSNVGTMLANCKLNSLTLIRLLTAVALSMRLMLLSRRRCGISRTLGGYGNYCLVLRHFAQATDSPDLQEDS